MKQKEKEYRKLTEDFKRFLTEDVSTVPQYLYHVAKHKDLNSVKYKGLLQNTKTPVTGPGKIHFTESHADGVKIYKKFFESDPLYENAIAVVVDTAKSGVNFIKDENGFYTESNIIPEAISKILRL